jgi:hypothetical protein
VKGCTSVSAEAWGCGLTRARAEPLVVELGSFIASSVSIESVKLKNLKDRALTFLSLDVGSRDRSDCRIPLGLLYCEDPRPARSVRVANRERACNAESA